MKVSDLPTETVRAADGTAVRMKVVQGEQLDAGPRTIQFSALPVNLVTVLNEGGVELVNAR